MKLSDRTVLFHYHGIPILGSKLTGNVIGLSPDGLDLCRKMALADIDRDDVASIDPALASALEQGGFLEGAAAMEAVKSAYVHVTQRCNLRCLGCYSDGPDRNRLGDPTVNDLARAFGILAEWGVRSINISGGEPFLRPDLPQICQAAKAAGIERITVLSNGLALDGNAVQAAAPYVDCISISFDGPSEDAPALIRGRQSFSALCDGLDTIAAAGVAPHIIATIHRLNTGDLESYVKLSQQKGTTLNFSLLSCCTEEALAPLLHDEASLRDLGRGMFALGEVLPQAALDAPLSLNLALKDACGAGRSTLSLAADGTVYPCHMLHCREFAFGNAFTDDAATLFASPAAEHFATMSLDSIGECADCDYRHLCGGGCRARAFHEDGSLEAKDPFCAMILEFYGLLGRSLAERFGAAV